MRIGAVLCIGIIVFMGPAVPAGTFISFSPASTDIMIMRIGAVMAPGYMMRVGVVGTEGLCDQRIRMFMHCGKTEACNSRKKNDNKDYSDSFFHVINLSCQSSCFMQSGTFG